jgi:hypothetical protein
MKQIEIRILALQEVLAHEIEPVRAGTDTWQVYGTYTFGVGVKLLNRTVIDIRRGGV